VAVVLVETDVVVLVLVVSGSGAGDSFVSSGKVVVVVALVVVLVVFVMIELDFMEGGSILSPVINLFLQLHVDCVSYQSGDYRTECLAHTLLLFFMLFKYIKGSPKN
jgi:hypothetical protein